jgi:hypothetical protein
MRAFTWYVAIETVKSVGGKHTVPMVIDAGFSSAGTLVRQVFFLIIRGWRLRAFVSG